MMGEKDTVEEHIADTLEVGDGICDKDAVAHCVKNSKSAIDWLIEMGVNFTMTQMEKNYILLKKADIQKDVLRIQKIPLAKKYQIL